MKLFDKVFNNIIKENNLKLHINDNIAIMAGSFRIPFKYDLDVINLLLQKVNKIIIIISGISKDRINNRQLSNTNISRLANLFSKYKLNSDMQYIIDNILTLSFKLLKKLLLNIKCENELKLKIIEYINSILNKIYNSVISYNNIELTADIIIDLFNILITDSRILYVIAQLLSPIMDAVKYVNLNCDNCQINLVTLDTYNEIETTWLSLLNLFNDNNKILLYFPYVKYTTNRNNVLKNINNGIKYFLSANQYKQIKDYLYELEKNNK